MKTLQQRLWDKIDKNGPVSSHRPDLGPCWIWKGHLSSKGYGLVWNRGRNERAHALTYKLLIGPTPKGLEPDHLCRVRNCANPFHLEFVTHKENVLRGEGLCAKNAKKTQCINGHPFTLENTILTGIGRACRECGRKRCREYMREKHGYGERARRAANA